MPWVFCEIREINCPAILSCFTAGVCGQAFQGCVSELIETIICCSFAHLRLCGPYQSWVSPIYIFCSRSHLLQNNIHFIVLLSYSASIVVFSSTKIERKHARAYRQSLLTSRPSPPTFTSFSTGYIIVSVFTGLLNLGGGILRLRRIHFLEFPRIDWIADFISEFDGGDEFMELLQAKWLVAMNDWTSLFLASTFILAAGFNFATIRQIRLKDREGVLEEGDNILPRYCYGPSTFDYTFDEKMEVVDLVQVQPQHFVSEKEPMKDGLLEEKEVLVDVS